MKHHQILVETNDMCALYLCKEKGKCPASHHLLGNCPVMQLIHQKIECLAQTDTTLLIYGETGTGKELAAETIHRLSARGTAPLVQVNCSAFSENLLESELFGHVKGAFTGATKDRLGRFEAAQGGTLFLDEIGDISLATQVRLLRVLEQKCIERVGCNIIRPLDVRVITATNKNLSAEVAAGRFRTDLLYRLNTVILSLPPLRERREDIPALTEHFIQYFNQRFSKKIKGITSDAMEELTGRYWPGNVRELKNAIEHAFVYCQGDVIDTNNLGSYETASPQLLREEKRKGYRRASTLLSNPIFPPTHPIQAANPDADILRKILEQHHWHLGHTAAALGIHRTTLWRLMQNFGLSKHN